VRALHSRVGIARAQVPGVKTKRSRYSRYFDRLALIKLNVSSAHTLFI
jgi:acyl carrier protein phosphodiesterase